MRTLFVLCLALAASGCQLTYKLPTRQGNVLEQKQLDQLKTGMTQDQVRYLLGTPLAASPFRNERWDYLGYYQSPRGESFQRTVSVYFDAARKVERLEGVAPEKGAAALASPDTQTLAAEEKKDKVEDSRAEAAAEQSIQPPAPDAVPEEKLPNP